MNDSASAVIRKAREADLPRLMELLFQLSALAELPEDEAAVAGEAEQQALRELQSGPNSLCAVLEVEGKVEGTLTLYVLPNLSHRGRPFAYVENVAVEQAQQGHGYGLLLMQWAEQRAREHGCYKIALSSNRKRPEAHRFYERLGYAASHQGFTCYFDRAASAEHSGQKDG